MLFIKPGYRNHFPFIIFYTLFLITGVFIFKDYGISWDEVPCRIDVAMANFEFMFKGHYDTLMNSNAKYHGPSFEILLFSLEKLFRLNDPRDIFLMRHLVNFLLFSIAVLFFYRLCLKRFNNKWISFLGPLFLVLSPRIFADSFYNSKDLAFLSFVIISLYTTTHFLERKNYGSAFINALISAFMVDIRIMGIIIPLFTGLILLIDFLKNPDQRKNIIRITLFFLFFLVGFIILFWPVLWRHPVEQFLLAFEENSKFPWSGNILYRGMIISSFNLPPDYLPFWILISTPLLYLLLFIVSLFFLAKKLIQYHSLPILVWLNLYVFFLPIISVLILNSVIYDGWRHLYFIYPSLIFIALTGVEIIFHFWKNNKIINLIIAGIIVHSIFIIGLMIQLHPYENLYFNSLAGNNLKEISKKYEMDYWCLSYREAMEYITKNDTTSNIDVYCAEYTPGLDNTNMLNWNDRNRIFVTTEPEIADYFVIAYRYRKAPLKGNSVFEIKRNEGVILSVFDTHVLKSTILNEKYVLTEKQVSYKEVRGELPERIVKIQSNLTGNFAEEIKPSIGFASGTSIKATPEMINSSKNLNYLLISFWIYSKADSDFKLIVEIDSTNNQIYHWTSRQINYRERNTWIQKKILLQLLPINSVNDVINTYIWNDTKSLFYIDDMSVKLYNIPKKEVKKILRNTPGETFK